MNITVYGKENCPWCVKAKELLNENKFNYLYQDINIPGFSKEYFRSTIAKGMTTVPVVVINGVTIGGYEALEKWVTAWKADVRKLRDMIADGLTFTVVFRKQDGTKRVMHCTTNPEFVPTHKHSTRQKPVHSGDYFSGLFTVFDVVAQDWRSFNAQTVEKIS